MSLIRSYVRTAQEALMAVENLRLLQDRFGELFERIGSLDRRAAVHVEEAVEFGMIQVEMTVPLPSMSHERTEMADEA